ncbi:hypothetical protein [Streptomyces xanthophaeus]|uniref:hypothetical protein n=1 Tax=Streptomyces xanthophaeus TaxID=67385 RepID=UPI00099D66C0|nr:hypothetical protein [Streptomyces xanthophaeus]WCD85672.1 hypothetical protein KPP03845_102007 [Streptomyces xanthophaeus]WST21764.1 hypothetical protein OG264_09790 [Streptomyces xanthophaeus]WST63250.1 hypothetical protein OG605_28570 [Streptomyces xanthophaeus]
MSRRVSLPGADELFRTTGGMALQSSSSRRGAEEASAAEHSATSAEGTAGEGRSREAEAAAGPGSPVVGQPRRPQEGSVSPGAQAGGRGKGQGRGANRRPSGRERHDEKITVYVSAEELMDLEHARLVLRGEHGLAVDRGRIVREAVAVVLADLESRGDASILVRRLRGR